MRIGLFTALSFGHEMHSLPVRIFQHDRQHRLACWGVGVALGDVPRALGLAITPTVASAVCEWPLTGNTGNRMLPTRASIERRRTNPLSREGVRVLVCAFSAAAMIG